MTVLDESPVVHAPAFAFDEFDVRLPEPPAAPEQRRFVDRRMQRARERLPSAEQIRRATIALCDRPYCLSRDEMTTLADVFLYNDAHGS